MRLKSRLSRKLTRIFAEKDGGRDHRNDVSYGYRCDVLCRPASFFLGKSIQSVQSKVDWRKGRGLESRCEV